MKYLLAPFTALLVCLPVNSQPTPSDDSIDTQIEFLKSRKAILEGSLKAPPKTGVCKRPIKNKMYADACAHITSNFKSDVSLSLKSISNKIEELEKNNSQLT